MAVTTSDLSEYLRLPPDTTEELSRYLAAAKSKARAAGIADYSNNAQYDLFLLALASMYYEFRAMSFEGTNQVSTEQAAWNLINSFVLELRYSGVDPEALP